MNLYSRRKYEQTSRAAAGSAYETAVNQGADPMDAFRYATAAGAAELLTESLINGLGRICFADHEEGLRLKPIMDSFKEFVKKCKSEKVDIAAATEPIADREAYLIARGRGHIIDDILREIWQAEIDKYSGMVLERVVLS